MRRLILLVALLLTPTAAFAQSTFAIPAGQLAPPVIVFPGAANQVLAVDGSVSAPSVAYASEPTTGLFRAGASDLRVTLGGTTYAQFNGDLIVHSASGFKWGNTGITSPDLFLTRATAGTLKIAHGTATSTAELQVSGGSGGFISFKELTELTTIAAAPTTSTVIQIPANALVYAVSVRVVTVIPTAATFTVTSATPAKTWNTVAVPVAANTTDPGTAAGPSFQTTASAIVITPNLTPGAATGQVRVTIYYIAVTPPTS